MKKLSLIFLIAVLALAGCIPGMPNTQNISGHGTVQLISGSIPGGTFVPGEASFSLQFACYAQNNNRLEGYLKWNDPANGVHISAILPETSVKAFTGGQYTTCKAMKAAASTLAFSVNVAGIYSQDGNADGDAGTLTGGAAIMVAQPGSITDSPCEPTGTVVAIEEVTSQLDLVYAAGGCLDRGKIVFGGGGQNQQ